MVNYVFSLVLNNCCWSTPNFICVYFRKEERSIFSLKTNEGGGFVAA